MLIPIIEESEGINSQAALYTFDCREVPPGRKALHELISCGTLFLLPPLAQGLEYIQFYCIANTPPPLVPDSPFRPDPALRLVVFQVGVNNLATSITLEGTTYYYLFVRSETLLRHEKYGPTWGGYRWETQWGRDALLIQKPGDPDIWLADEASNDRCLIMESHTSDGDEPDPPMSIMLYEFPPAEALRRDLAHGQGAGKWEYVMGPHMLADESVWQRKQVKSGLPFRKVDTGLVAYPLVMPGEMKEHAITGDFYLQYSDA